jgi:hypothetical protein
LSRHRTFFVAFRYGGFKAGLAHLSSRLFGDPRFLRPASSIDFRHFGLTSSSNLDQFIHALIPSKSSSDIEDALSKSKEGIDRLMAIGSEELNYPQRWNSGRNLQYLLSTMVILLKPTVVVETGSANGASALAICFALDQNKAGHLWSYDIESTVGQLVPNELRSKVSFVNVSGHEHDFAKELQSLDLASGASIFLHDSDHSYLGQQSDYTLASQMGFDYILSDDVDTSLAFCDFARGNGKIFFDAPKFIGAVLGSKK